MVSLWIKGVAENETLSRSCLLLEIHCYPAIVSSYSRVRHGLKKKRRMAILVSASYPMLPSIEHSSLTSRTISVIHVHDAHKRELPDTVDGHDANERWYADIKCEVVVVSLVVVSGASSRADEIYRRIIRPSPTTTCRFC